MMKEKKDIRAYGLKWKVVNGNRFLLTIIWLNYKKNNLS